MRSLFYLLLIALFILGFAPHLSRAQDADKFDSRDLKNLPKFYETQITYVKKILNIQDISLSLSSVADVDIYHDYCVKRLDSDRQQNRKFRNYANSQEDSVKDYQKMIDTNEDAMTHEILEKLYENSGLEHTSKDEMIDAVKPPLDKARRRSKEVMRRMLIHDMVWHISDCKRTLQALESETPIPPDAFVKNSIKSYLALLADSDNKTQALADRLLKPLPTTTTTTTTTAATATTKEKAEGKK